MYVLHTCNKQFPKVRDGKCYFFIFSCFQGATYVYARMKLEYVAYCQSMPNIHVCGAFSKTHEVKIEPAKTQCDAAYTLVNRYIDGGVLTNHKQLNFLFCWNSKLEYLAENLSYLS